MGKLTDDELANGAFMNYDQPLNLAGIIAGTHSSPIAWMTAVKDRIRWLSRSLDMVVDERDAIAAEMKALREQGPVARIDDDESFQGPCRHAMAFVPMHRGSPLYAYPVPARELTDAVDDLAQHIRQIDGNHSMGAGELAESIAEWVDRYLKGEAK